MFISIKKKYQLDHSKTEESFIESVKEKAATLNTLVFLNDIDTGSASEELLLKILGAVKLSSDNYQFINKSEFPQIRIADFNSNEFQNVDKVLIFGLKAEQIGLNTISNKYVSLTCGNYQLLFSDDLETLQAQPPLKGKLWNQLKAMYEV